MMKWWNIGTYSQSAKYSTAKPLPDYNYSQCDSPYAAKKMTAVFAFINFILFAKLSLFEKISVSSKKAWVNSTKVVYR